ncbi:MAG TPA: hypothetical protein VMT33_03560 [Candidatus Bathyarchaeia archaeon]|nr:hypothetical protein [Candidatus Bathyarchaeia archaeon]
MKRKAVGGLVSVSILLALDAAADPARYAIETFDGTLDRASWRSGPADAIVPEGGNDDGHLSTGPIVTDMPSLATSGMPTPFTGLYRMMGVADLGVDLQVFATDSSDGDRPLTLELTRDDCAVIKVGKRIASSERRWASYTFKVPAYMTSIPNAWTVRGACGVLSQDAAWNFVMQFVTEARFVLGDPGVRYPEESWDVGFDNPRIKVGGKGDSGGVAAPETVPGTKSPSAS